ncbi:cilia- and flagella-associated protein HOATZ [Genypterus blacodes]|uniref:cilia- and flagella-associated protein HOATZ n=1 Tax=Genypterus blacodes TaxID=154954 RepID=UPI003F759618
MSARAASPTETDFLVFDGSSVEDVSHAKQLWNSLSLQPPLESRLVSADIRQRLPVSRLRRGSTGAQPKRSAPEPPRFSPAWQRQEERERYLAMADQRREILAMVRRQREQRIQKELLSQAYRYKVTNNRGKMEKGECSELELEQELVRQLK